MLAQRRESQTIDPVKLLFGKYGKIPEAQRPFTRAFKQKIKIDFERGNFRIKTAENEAELEEVLQLRYDIFHREFQKKLFPYGVDLEALDTVADHLIIIDKVSQKIVGTYRVISSTFSNKFYSQGEFNIQGLLNSPGAKIELSRAGIHKGFRTGIVMALLWRGVSEYMRAVKAEYIFGCASVKTTWSDDVVFIKNLLEKRGVLTEEFGISPTPAYRMPERHPILPRKKMNTETLPPLFEGYLRAGAKVISEPALDRDFKCIDFFTVLRVAEMDKTFERKYGK